MSNDCLFCKIIRGEVPAEKLYEDDEVLAFRDIAPQAPVHFLVIPKHHISTLEDATPEHDSVLGKMFRISTEVAAQEGLQGFRATLNNGRVAGQVIFHSHLHIIGGRELGWPPG
ncbi:MAG: histidine triad nucleotide-binding protein [Desulfobulbus propionicus]|nr:MAG: histidine triad nucleotide-binding protein [Desulfobulbus propionicus]